MAVKPVLPALKWRASPNCDKRHALALDLIVIHDCQGGYEGSIQTFLGHGGANGRVSAHLVLKEDGSEATQMVGFRKNAWHCRAFNSRSIGVEMAGFEEKGFSVAEWDAAAAIAAYLCHRFAIPVQWAQHGKGPGICRHLDLGAAGGGHVDPTKDPHVWGSYLDLVSHHARLGAWPAEPWGRD